MKKRTKSIFFAIAAVVCAVGVAASTSLPAFADDNCTGVLPKSWCDEDSGLENMINTIIDVLSALVVFVAVGFITYSGVIWMTALDDAGKVAKAKTRIFEIVIGLLVYFALWAVIKFVVVN